MFTFLSVCAGKKCGRYLKRQSIIYNRNSQLVLLFGLTYMQNIRTTHVLYACTYTWGSSGSSIQYYHYLYISSRLFFFGEKPTATASNLEEKRRNCRCNILWYCIMGTANSFCFGSLSITSVCWGGRTCYTIYTDWYISQRWCFMNYCVCWVMVEIKVFRGGVDLCRRAINCWNNNTAVRLSCGMIATPDTWELSRVFESGGPQVFLRRNIVVRQAKIKWRSLIINALRLRQQPTKSWLESASGPRLSIYLWGSLSWSRTIQASSTGKCQEVCAADSFQSSGGEGS